MVFEGVVAEVIDRFLGSFLQEVTKKQLKIGLFTGDAVLKNIEIKPQAFEAFDLPLSVNRGVVGKLTVRVPWTSLKTESVVVHLQDIYILASYSSSNSANNSDTSSLDDIDDTSSSEKFLKFLKLDKKKTDKEKDKDKSKDQSSDTDEDAAALEEQQQQSGKKKKDGFKEKLVTKIINNVQIVVEKVHIRIEERTSDGGEARDMAMGFCLDKLFIQSTDDNWIPTFIDSTTATTTSTSSVLNKLAELSNLSIYLDHDMELMSHLSTKDLCNALRESIPTSKDSRNHHMLLDPFSASFKLKLHQAGSIQNISKIEIESVIDEIGLSMEPQQYSSLLNILETLSEFVSDIKEDKQSIVRRTFQKEKEKEEKEKEKEKDKDKDKDKDKEKEKDKDKKEKKKDKEKEEKKKKKKEKEEKKKKALKGNVDFEVVLPPEAINIELDQSTLTKPSKEILKQQLYDTIGYISPVSIENHNSLSSSSLLTPPIILNESNNSNSSSGSAFTTSPNILSPSLTFKDREININIQINTIHLQLLDDNPEKDKDKEGPLIYGDINGIQLSMTKKSGSVDQLVMNSTLKSIKLSGLWVQDDHFPDMISSSEDEVFVHFQMKMQPILSTPIISPLLIGSSKSKRPRKHISISIQVTPIYFVLNSTAILRYLNLITPSHEINLSGFSKSSSSSSSSSTTPVAVSKVINTTASLAATLKNSVDLNIIAQSPTFLIPISTPSNKSSSTPTSNVFSKDNSILIIDLGKVSLDSVGSNNSNNQPTNQPTYKTYQITTMNVQARLCFPPSNNCKIQQFCSEYRPLDHKMFETSLIVQLDKRESNEASIVYPKIKMTVNIPSFTIYFSPYSFYQIRLFIYLLMEEIKRVEQVFVASFQFKIKNNLLAQQQPQQKKEDRLDTNFLGLVKMLNIKIIITDLMNPRSVNENVLLTAEISELDGLIQVDKNLSQRNNHKVSGHYSLKDCDMYDNNGILVVSSNKTKFPSNYFQSYSSLSSSSTNININNNNPAANNSMIYGTILSTKCMTNHKQSTNLILFKESLVEIFTSTFYSNLYPKVLGNMIEVIQMIVIVNRKVAENVKKSSSGLSVSMVKVNISTKGIKAVLYNQLDSLNNSSAKELVCRFDMKEVDLEISKQNSDYLKLDFFVEGFEILDCFNNTSNGTMYQKILSNLDDSNLLLTFKYHDAKKQSLLHLDTDINRMKIIVLPQFIKKLVNYALDVLQYLPGLFTKKQGAGSKTKAPKKRKKKIIILANMEAPLIVLPENENSMDQLIIDLGVLKINSQLQETLVLYQFHLSDVNLRIEKFNQPISWLMEHFNVGIMMQSLVVWDESDVSDKSKLCIDITIGSTSLKLGHTDIAFFLNRIFNNIPIIKGFQKDLGDLKKKTLGIDQKQSSIQSPRLSITSPLRKSTASPLRLLNNRSPTSASVPPIPFQLYDNGDNSNITTTNPLKHKLNLNINVGALKFIIQDIPLMFFVHDTKVCTKIDYSGSNQLLLSIGKIYLFHQTITSDVPIGKVSIEDIIHQPNIYQQIISLKDDQVLNTLEMNFSSCQTSSDPHFKRLPQGCNQQNIHPFDSQLLISILQIQIALSLPFLHSVLDFANPILSIVFNKQSEITSSLNQSQSIDIINDLPAAPALKQIESPTFERRILRKENSIVIPLIGDQVKSKAAAKKLNRIKIIIDIQSPQITITVNRRDIILVDLGKLHIENLFYHKSLSSTSGELNFESMEIQLSNLFVDIIHENNTRNEMLQDINLVVDIDIIDDLVQFSLIPDKCPLQKVDISCKSISIMMSLMDYNVLMDILQHYLSLVKVSLDPILQKKKQLKGSSHKKKKVPMMKNSKPMIELTQIQVNLSELRFSISGDYGQENNDSIAMLQLNDLGAMIDIVRGVCVDMDVFLRSIRLSDTRINSGSQFIDLFCSKNITTFEGPLKDSVNLSQNPSFQPIISSIIKIDKANNNINLHCKIDRPRVYISPTIVFQIIQFIMGPMTEFTKKMKESKAKVNRPIASSGAATKQKRSLNIEANVNKIKILLVENPTSQTSNLVIAKLSIDATFTEKLGCQREINGSLVNFQMFSFRHSIANVSSSRAASLIDPFNLKFVCVLLQAKDPFDSSKSSLVIDLNASLDPFNLFLSYHDTLLLALIAGQLTSTFPKLKPSLAKSAGGKKSLSKKTNMISLQVIAPQIALTLVNDFMDQNLPLLDLCLYRLDFKLSGIPTEQLTIDLKSKLLADYFNINKMAFEPLIENFEFSFQFIKSAKHSPKSSITLKSDQFLNINLTYGFVYSVLSTYNSIQSDLSSTLPIIINLFKNKKSQNFGKLNSVQPLSKTPPSISIISPQINSSSRTITPQSIPLITTGNRVRASSMTNSMTPTPKFDFPLSPSLLPITESSLHGGGLSPEIILPSQLINSGSIPRSTSYNTFSPNLINSSGGGSKTRSSGLLLPSPIMSGSPVGERSSPLLQTISIRKLTSSFHPYWIVNKSGVDLFYSIKVESRADIQNFTIENEEKQPISINSKSLISVKKARDFRGVTDPSLLDQGPQIMIGFQSQMKKNLTTTIGGTVQFSSGFIPIGRVGYRQIKVNGRKLIFQVGWNEDGSKQITIRSNVLIRNTTSINLEIKFISKGLNNHVSKVLFPDEEYPVPLPFLNCGKYVSIIPMHESIEYHNSPSDIIPLEDDDLKSLFKISTCFGKKSLPPFKLILTNGKEQDNNNMLDIIIDNQDEIVSHSINHNVDKKEKSKVVDKILGAAKEIKDQDNQIQKKQIQRIIQILPPFIIENLLPCSLQMEFLDSNHQLLYKVSLDSCQDTPVYAQDPRESVFVRIFGIPGYPVQTHQLVDCDQQAKPIVKSKIRLVDPNKVVKPLSIMIGNREEFEGIRKLSFYSVYWIINKINAPMIFQKPNLIPRFIELDKERKIPQMFAKTKFLNNAITEVQHRAYSSSSSNSNSKYCTIDTTLVLYSSDILRIKVANSQWSNIVSLETIGADGIITCYADARNDPREFNFRASISIGKLKLQRTRMVTIHYQYIFTNSSSSILFYRQEGQSKYETINPNESKPFHWMDRYAPKLIQIKFPDNAYQWSGTFSIDDHIGELCIKLRNNSNQRQSYLARVDIRDNDSHSAITFLEEDPSAAPFRIENQTPRAIRFHQVGCNTIDVLQANCSTDYVWDQLTGTRVLKVEIWNSFATGNEQPVATMNCNIMKIKSFKPVKVGTNTIYGYVKVDGATRVLILSYDPNNQQELSDNEQQQPENTKLDIQVNLPRIGVNVIDSPSKELIYLSLNDISLSYSISNIYSRLEVIITNIQIDNQLPHTDYPVLFYHVNNSNNEAQDPKPFLHFSFIKNEQNKGLKYFEMVSLLIQEVNIMLEDNILASFIELVTKIKKTNKKFKQYIKNQNQNNSNNNNNDNLTSSTSSLNSNSPASQSPTLKPNNNNNLSTTTTSTITNTQSPKNKSTLPNEKKKKKQMIYIKLLLLNPIKVILSFSFVRDGILEQTSDVAGVLLEVLGVSFGLERTTLKLNSLILEHPFLSQRSFISRIKSHYTMQTLNQLYKVLGSSDNIGNPVGLFNHLSTGVKDFFYEPAMGLITSPKDFGKGLAKGSISLVKNSVYGLFNTLSKLTSTIGKGVAILSFDEQYLLRRQRARQKKAKHIGDGLAYGVKGLGRGVIEGVTGIVTKPYEGAQKNGIEGFAKGVAQGVIGVGVKPVVGVLDLASITTEGIRNTTNLFKDTTRVRPPRSFGPENLLIEYNFEQSEGEFIIQTTFKGTFANEEYVIHFNHGKSITLVTKTRIIYVRASNYSFKWSASFSNIKSIDIVPEGIYLQFEHLQRIMLVDYRTQYTIPISDKDQILQLYLIIKDEIRANNNNNINNSVNNNIN